MNYRELLICSISILTIAGCATPDKVVFVTSTDINIGYDATVGSTNIGYDRNELVVGPGYPETGATPPVFARMQSNLSLFAPEIKQLYATGDAARAATKGFRRHCQYDSKDPFLLRGNPAPSGGNLVPVPVTCAEPAMGGNRRILYFGTTTSFGLKTMFTQNVPTAVTIGFKRKEFSIIPLQDLSVTPGVNKAPLDDYASVLGGITIGSQITTSTGTKVGLDQFFATGAAADNLATQKTVQDIFTTRATDALQAGQPKLPASTSPGSASSSQPEVPRTQSDF